MSSPFAERFNALARPMLWQQHAETVVYRRPGQPDADLRLIFLRQDPAKQDQESLEEFHATATAVVKFVDLPKPDGKALLIRNEVTWAIRRIERQDAWTYVLHLAQPKADLRLATRGRG